MLSASPNLTAAELARFYAQIHTGPACHEWAGGRDKNGYGKVTIRTRSLRAHRVAYWLEHGPLPAGVTVRHTCDNPPCCRIDHLLTGTNLANQHDMTARGRGRIGERNGRAVITAEIVREIRAHYPQYQSLDELAVRFGISRAHVWRIATGKNWRHL